MTAVSDEKVRVYRSAFKSYKCKSPVDPQKEVSLSVFKRGALLGKVLIAAEEGVSEVLQSAVVMGDGDPLWGEGVEVLFVADDGSAHRVYYEFVGDKKRFARACILPLVEIDDGAYVMAVGGGCIFSTDHEGLFKQLRQLLEGNNENRGRLEFSDSPVAEDGASPDLERVER